MESKGPSNRVEVVVLPDAKGKACAPVEKRKIEQVVLESALPKSGEPYHKAQVAVQRDAGGSPKKLVVTLLRANTYTADRVEVTVDAKYGVKSVKSQLAGD